MKKASIILVVLASIAAFLHYILIQPMSTLPVVENTVCPTPETFVNDFNSWSIDFLADNPGYAEKEQREGWQRHLEDMGCVESQGIIDEAVCADCEGVTE